MKKIERTIEKISRYNFTQEEITNMKRVGIINGCGGKGGINFSEIVELFFINFVEFKEKKLDQLWLDIEVLCYEHDYDYYLQKGFLKSNFIFAKGVSKLIKSWTSFGERFVIFVIIFYLLNKYGKKYYSK